MPWIKKNVTLKKKKITSKKKTSRDHSVAQALKSFFFLHIVLQESISNFWYISFNFCCKNALNFVVQILIFYKARESMIFFMCDNNEKCKQKTQISNLKGTINKNMKMIQYHNLKKLFHVTCILCWYHNKPCFDHTVPKNKNQWTWHGFHDIYCTVPQLVVIFKPLLSILFTQIVEFRLAFNFQPK